MDSIAIGIDLGTTNSCVAVVRSTQHSSGNVDVLANVMGRRVTPSIVAFTENGRVVGNAAKDQMIWNPENTVYEVKRLIGRKVEEEGIKKKIDQWPFKVSADSESSEMSIEVESLGISKSYAPEQISAMVLSDIKKTAEDSLNCKVTKAVITVPAYFTNSQRQATIDAGMMAGLEVLDIIHEPTAAAIAYGFGRRDAKEQNVLVYDLGGGTLDVVIMAIKNNHYKVKAVSGNRDLGGSDFDMKLAEYLIESFKTKNEIGEIDSRAKSKILRESEAAKINLSAPNNTRVTVRCDSIYESLNIETNFTKAKFEDLCSDLIDEAMEPLDAVLKDAKMNKEDIDEVILVGGSTRIPAIEERVSEFFGGKSMNKSINPDEAVAYGAAIHAARLSGDTSLDEVKLFDVTPFDIGVLTKKSFDKFVCIIPRNTQIPTKIFEENLSTLYDNQKSVTFPVREQDMEGRRIVLGEFVLRDIEIAPQGVPKLKVKMSINRAGILSAFAEDLRMGSTKSITIDFINGRLSADDINKMRIEEANYQSNHMDTRKRYIARDQLEECALKMKRRARERNQFNLVRVCNDALEWLEDNDDSSVEECDAKRAEIQLMSLNLD